MTKVTMAEEEEKLRKRVCWTCGFNLGIAVAVSLFSTQEMALAKEFSSIRINFVSSFGDSFVKDFSDAITRLDFRQKLASRQDDGPELTIEVFATASADDFLDSPNVSDPEKFVSKIKEFPDFNVQVGYSGDSAEENTGIFVYLVGTSDAGLAEADCIARDLYKRINRKDDGSIVLGPWARLDFETCEEVE